VKILLVNDLGAPHGGAELLTLSLRAGLRERGHDARLFASSAASEAGPNEADYACFGTTSRLRTLNRIVNPSAPLRLRQALREFRPDVVHVRMFLSQLSPLILPLLRKIPTLYHAALSETICPTGLKMLPDGSPCRQPCGAVCLNNGCLSWRSWAPLMLQQQLWRHWQDAFDLIVANSAWMRDRLLENGVGPVEVLWNGVPVVPVRPPLAWPPTVTCAGRLSWEKGLDVLIGAFATVVEALPEAKLLIAGSGPQRGSLQRLIGELRLEPNVFIMGQMAKPEMERSFGSGWVHAVPSRVQESFGLTAAEAMMRGTAVIASRAGGLAEIIVDGETGLLTPTGDVKALASSLLRVLSNRDLAEQLGQNARRHAMQHMDRERWIDGFVNFYQGLISREQFRSRMGDHRTGQKQGENKN
jgi:glycosyltransferase involved in cell wall biosynthesis